jgi:phage recombination protein Bet
MWSSAAKNGAGGMVDKIWPGIGELRTTATRTKSYAGRDATIYGPTVTGTYGGVDVEHPEWCEVVVYRIVGGHRVAFHGPRVYWRETYATKKHDSDVPNSMWLSRPFGQIEKCGEAAAIRAAFPEEAGNEYTADEMEGKVIEGRFSQVAQVEAPVAARQETGDKLAQFAADHEPAGDEEPEAEDESDEAQLENALSLIRAAVTPKTFSATRKAVIPLMGRFDEHWPDGKAQIVAALAEQEQIIAGGA